MARAGNRQLPRPTGPVIGSEAELWRMADALRGSVDAAEYQHVVLGLIFLKYISDAFEEHRARLLAERDQGADPEDPDEYRAQNVFRVPPEARWERLQQNARQPTIGQSVDEAMVVIERDNPSLKGVLPKDYARPALDKQRLGQRIDLVTNIRNPPVTMTAWDGEQLRENRRWKFGVPPVRNANFVWVQHITHRLAPRRISVDIPHHSS